MLIYIYLHFLLYIQNVYIFEEFGDTKLIIIGCKSRKDKQYNDQTKKDRIEQHKPH